MLHIETVGLPPKSAFEMEPESVYTYKPLQGLLRRKSCFIPRPGNIVRVAVLNFYSCPECFSIQHPEPPGLANSPPPPPKPRRPTIHFQLSAEATGAQGGYKKAAACQPPQGWSFVPQFDAGKGTGGIAAQGVHFKAELPPVRGR